MNKTKKVVRIVLCGAVSVCAFVVGDVVAGTAGGGTKCTASVTCDGVTITSTMATLCPVGRRCAGIGGCEPEAWVSALCLPELEIIPVPQ